MAEKITYKKIYRSETDRILGGVCGGLAEYFEIDPTIVRLIFALITIFGGSGVVLYIILWVLIPSKSYVDSETDENIKRNTDEIRAKARNFRQNFKHSENRDGKHFIGIFIILLGILFVFDNLGFFNFHLFWPLILIFLGIALIWR